MPGPAGLRGRVRRNGIWFSAGAKRRTTAAPVKVINPNLTPEQISEVSQQLSQILAEEM